MSKPFNRPVNSPKYANQGFIAKELVSRFFSTLTDLLTLYNSLSGNRHCHVIELGAGEGHTAKCIIESLQYGNTF